jgi:hypothetical protein
VLKASDTLGVEAWFLVDRFRHGLQEYERGLKEGEKATEEFKNKVGSSSKKADDSIQDSILSMKRNWMQGMVALGVFTAAVAKGYKEIEEAAKARGMREAFTSMGEFYGVDAGALVKQLKEVSDGTLSTAQAVEVANRAMMAGGQAFASEVPRLFEIARAAAVATGKDVMWVFETLTRGIAKGSPLLIDNAEIYMSIGSALDEYAASLGKTTEEMTRQEKTQATLNAVLTQGAPLVEAVGDKALAATQPFEELASSATDMKDALLAAATAGGSFEMALEILSRGLIALAKSGVIAISAIKGIIAVYETLTHYTDLVITGQIDLGRVFEHAMKQSFDEGAKALGIYADKSDEVVQATEDIGQAAEQTVSQMADLDRALEDLHVKYAERIIDMETQAAQREIDNAIKRARRLEDIARDSARQRERINEQYYQRLADIEAQNEQATESARYEHARRMADIERQYQERILQIERQYQETMYDAIASRDATSALRAMRTRQTELDDARRQRDQQKSDASTDYARQINDLRQSLAQQKEEARRAREEQLADLKENEQRQREELERSLRQQEEDQARHDQWKLEAMQREFEAEYWQAYSSYTNQENLYRQHLLNMQAIWAQFAGSLTLTGTGHAGQHLRNKQGTQYLAEGGAMIASQPTHLVVGEGRYPELVVAQPLSPVAAPMRANVSGSMRHDVSGAVSAQMAGFEGRLSAAVSQAVQRAFVEVLR